MYSYGSPHMAAQKQDDQLERTFSSYVRIQAVVLKTYLGRLNDREEWRERVRDIRATSAIWWWWWWWYIYDSLNTLSGGKSCLVAPGVAVPPWATENCVITPGWRLMKTWYRTCFHTLYDKKNIYFWLNNIDMFCLHIFILILLKVNASSDIYIKKRNYQ